jgi:hypothetical protein
VIMAGGEIHTGRSGYILPGLVQQYQSVVSVVLRPGNHAQGLSENKLVFWFLISSGVVGGCLLVVG